MDLKQTIMLTKTLILHFIIFYWHFNILSYKVSCQSSNVSDPVSVTTQPYVNKNLHHLTQALSAWYQDGQRGLYDSRDLQV